MVMPAMAPGDIDWLLVFWLASEPAGLDAAVSIHAVTEKLFDFEGVTAVHFQLGPIFWQKLSKKDVSQPCGLHRPQTPQELHVANPVHESLLTVFVSSPASMKEVGALTDDREQDMEVGGEDVGT
jgi:hypothetical protein